MKRALLWTAILGLGGIGALLVTYLPFRSAPLLEVWNLPEVYPRRAGVLTANVTGTLTRHARSGEWRLNEGPWLPLAGGFPRAQKGSFVLEMAGDDLRPGENTLSLRGHAWLRAPESRTLRFRYDPAPITLPLHFDWSKGTPEAQDGAWERFQTAEGWRVRPKPGTEEYDRMLLLTGAFAGARRIRTTAVLRSHHREMPWGFGVLTLWGGHADTGTIRPRRGWRFGLSWFYAYQNGVGSEFSTKEGGGPAVWVNTYRTLAPRTGVTYHLLAEVWAERDGEGNHLRHVQRSKWWQEGEAEPTFWMSVGDDEGAPLPPGDYACGLLAHRCQAEFGPVTIEERS